MELQLKPKEEKKINFVDKNFVFSLNKLTFLSGNIRETEIIIYTLANTVEHTNHGGTHGNSFSLPFIIPLKVDLLKAYDRYNHISVELLFLTITNLGNTDVIIDFDLLNE